MPLTQVPPKMIEGGPAFSASQSAGTQSFSAAVWTKLQFPSEVFDTANCYDNVTNYRFTPNVAGYYQVNLFAAFNNTSSTSIGVYKNGTLYRSTTVSNPSLGTSPYISVLIYLNGTTDYIEAWGYSSNAGTVLYANAGYYEFSAFLARAA